MTENVQTNIPHEQSALSPCKDQSPQRITPAPSDVHALVPHPIVEYYQQQCFNGTFEAASLFCDISGFTALTETLMQYKKEGAEALTRALNDIFFPLVHMVYARGGFITTFAGDAFTALFPIWDGNNEDAIFQATHTALFIQHFFIDHATIETPYGTFPINAKVGLGIGHVTWGILGDTSPSDGRTPMLTYFFRGPAIDRCAHAEHEAERGDIVVHHVLLDSIASSATYTPVVHHAKLLSVQGTRLQRQQSLTPVSREVIHVFLPDQVLDLIANQTRAEFRTVSIVFLSFDEPPDHETLSTFVTTVLKLAAIYEGYVNKLDFGDKGGVILIAFGAPITHERDRERAADFVLTLREWVTTPRWRAGLTSGTVYAGFMGGKERAEYTTIGDIVNLAARLMMKADWVTIWTSANIALFLQEKGYDLESLGSFTFKGKSTSVAVWQLVSNHRVEETNLYSGTMVGRQNELLQLVAWVWPLFQGTSVGITTIYGEAGIGKSRLAYELRQRLLGNFQLRWFICPADAILRQSLNPFRSMLRTYFEQSAIESPEQNKARFTAILQHLVEKVRVNESTHPRACDIASELDRTYSFLGALLDLTWRGSLYEQVDPQLRFENTLLACKTLFLAESLLNPVLIQIDNLHWLDSDSYKMITFLVRTLRDYPVAFLCTSRYRDDGSTIELPLSADVLHQIVHMETLNGAEIHQFVADILQGDITDELQGFIQEKTSGNPFFVEQLTLDLYEQQAVTHNDIGVWSLTTTSLAAIPTSINAVLVARLDRLTTDLKHVVQTASVLGREFTILVLTRMLHKPANDVENLVRDGETERIWTLIQHIRGVFRHSLLCDTAYDMQLRERLIELHALAATTIEDLYVADLASHYADLAYHYGKAHNTERERVYAHHAGEHAAAQFANSEALTYLNRALELLPDDDDVTRYRVVLLREQVYDRLGMRDLQSHDLATLTTLANQIQDWQRQAEVALRQANYGTLTGNYFMAIVAVKYAVSCTTHQPDSSLQARAYLEWGKILRLQGEYAEARQHIQQALTQSQRMQHRQIEAESRHQLGAISYFEGDFDAAVRYDEEALALYRSLDDRHGEARTLDSLGSDACDQGNLDTAIHYYEHALDLYRAIGSQWGIGNTIGNLGQVYRERGACTQATMCFEQGLAICQAIGDQKGLGLSYSNLGWIYLDQGAYEQARAAFHEALTIARTIRARGEEGWILASMALLAYVQSDYATARKHSLDALEMAQTSGESSTEGDAWTCLGHALAGMNLLAEATKAYTQACELWREMEMESRLVEAQAGLAQVALKQGNLGQAMDYVEKIMLYRDDNEAFAGADQPFFIFLTCYEVLHACEDSRAEDIKHAAQNLLVQQADCIADPELRRSFFERVRTNRLLMMPHPS